MDEDSITQQNLLKKKLAELQVGVLSSVLSPLVPVLVIVFPCDL